MRALFVLTPAESKRLIGRAVAELKEVRYAKKNDKILIGHGSTNFFVAEEIMGKQKITKMWKENKYLSGAIQKGTLCTIIGAEKPPLLILNRGVVIPPADTMNEVLRDFGKDSVFIKGGNAVDPRKRSCLHRPSGGRNDWVGIRYPDGAGDSPDCPRGSGKIGPFRRQSCDLLRSGNSGLLPGTKGRIDPAYRSKSRYRDYGFEDFGRGGCRPGCRGGA